MEVVGGRAFGGTRRVLVQLNSHIPFKHRCDQVKESADLNEI